MHGGGYTKDAAAQDRNIGVNIRGGHFQWFSFCVFALSTGMRPSLL
jgi:hypothetical protein